MRRFIYVVAIFTRSGGKPEAVLLKIVDVRTWRVEAKACFRTLYPYCELHELQRAQLKPNSGLG